MSKTQILFITLFITVLAWVIPDSTAVNANPSTFCEMPGDWSYEVEHIGNSTHNIYVTTYEPSGSFRLRYLNYWEVFIADDAPDATRELLDFTEGVLIGKEWLCDVVGNPQLEAWNAVLIHLDLIVKLNAPHCELPRQWVGNLEFSQTSGFQIEAETNFPGGGFTFTRDGHRWTGYIDPAQHYTVRNLYTFTYQYLTTGEVICDIENSDQLQAWLAQLDELDESIHTISLPVIINQPPPYPCQSSETNPISHV